MCFLDPVGIFFLDLHVFVLDPGEFFSTAKLIVFELGFCFLDPCACFVDLASIEWGGNSIVIGAHIGLDVFGPWRLLFWNPYMFFWTWHRAGGILILRQNSCKKLLMPAGEVPALKQKKRKKWWRRQWGKSMHEAS